MSAAAQTHTPTTVNGNGYLADAELAEFEAIAATEQARAAGEHDDGVQVMSTGAEDAPSAEQPVPYRFAPLADFATHRFPKAEPLLGRPDAIYLPAGGLLMVYGAGGSAKSTWSIDGIAHLAAGEPWLGIDVPRPVKCLVLENEGPPGLFQHKIQRKRESWDGPDFAPNIHIYSAPWGAFSFADAGARRALATHCDEHAIELVMANPTLGLGVAASGRPDETGQFVEWLKDCGLWNGRSFWLLHHENKQHEISGDWGRHPDTQVLLQADGNQPRTRLTWQKVRWAPGLEPGERALMLDWITETEGYVAKRLDTTGATDDELVERLVAYLDEHPCTATQHVIDNVEGTDGKLSKLLRDRPEFDCVKGEKNANLWMLAGLSADGEPQ